MIKHWQLYRLFLIYGRSYLVLILPALAYLAAVGRPWYCSLTLHHLVVIRFVRSGHLTGRLFRPAQWKLLRRHGSQSRNSILCDHSMLEYSPNRSHLWSFVTSIQTCIQLPRQGECEDVYRCSCHPCGVFRIVQHIRNYVFGPIRPGGPSSWCIRTTMDEDERKLPSLFKYIPTHTLCFWKVISPLLIILRVVRGRAWTVEITATSRTSLAFATQSAGVGSTTLADGRGSSHFGLERLSKSSTSTTWYCIYAILCYLSIQEHPGLRD